MGWGDVYRWNRLCAIRPSILFVPSLYIKVLLVTGGRRTRIVKSLTSAPVSLLALENSKEKKEKKEKNILKHDDDEG